MNGRMEHKQGPKSVGRDASLPFVDCIFYLLYEGAVFILHSLSKYGMSPYSVLF